MLQRIPRMRINARAALGRDVFSIRPRVHPINSMRITGGRTSNNRSPKHESSLLREVEPAHGPARARNFPLGEAQLGKFAQRMVRDVQRHRNVRLPSFRKSGWFARPRGSTARAPGPRRTPSAHLGQSRRDRSAHDRRSTSSRSQVRLSGEGARYGRSGGSRAEYEFRRRLYGVARVRARVRPTPVRVVRRPWRQPKLPLSSARAGTE
mmetsp:Transcript_4364/g.15135  ORF Transcript_4364/g.15135 Transcript_4364/m.15135 type:complete len:208 (+) Transcript_4364:153-776(+)